MAQPVAVAKRYIQRWKHRNYGKLDFECIPSLFNRSAKGTADQAKKVAQSGDNHKVRRSERQAEPLKPLPIRV